MFVCLTFWWPCLCICIIVHNNDQRQLRLELREELELLEDGAERFHELLAGVVMDALVSSDHDARVLGQALHLFLHIARMVGAPVVAPACMHVSAAAAVSFQIVLDKMIFTQVTLCTSCINI